MDIPDLEPRIKHILTNRLGIAPEDLRRDANLVDDLGVDSLDAVELVIAIEREFRVTTSDDQVSQLKTVADMIALVQRLAVEQESRTPSRSGGPARGTDKTRETRRPA
ncbi:MAG TPA: acyl carrier protein [Methylomirabilota bacterium]|jgi:acyl carrier protein|nr:acyl carrier protein [Methylomirabilota bacterium]